MQTIATFYTHQQADLLRIRLESNGIRVFLKDEFTGSIAAFAIAAGGIKVQIPEEDISAVRELLETDQELKDIIVPKSARCPNCSSIDISRQGKHSASFMIFAILCFGLPFMFYAPIFECNKCRHSWKKH